MAPSPAPRAMGCAVRVQERDARSKFGSSHADAARAAFVILMIVSTAGRRVKKNSDHSTDDLRYESEADKSKRARPIETIVNVFLRPRKRQSAGYPELS